MSISYIPTMLEEKLAEIGFSRNECKIYLELLTIGSQPVSVVAKRIGFNRTTAYSILRSLEKKGLVASYVNRGMKFFIANDPNCLVGYVDRKCKFYDYYRTELLSIIPKFRSLVGMYSFKKPIVSFYDGLEGVKHVMYDALTARGECCAYLCLDKWFKSGMRDFLLEYKDFRIAIKKISLRAIVPDTRVVRAFFENNYDRENKLTEVKYLPSAGHENVFENEMNIYDDKVAIIHLDRGQEYGVVIESREIFMMQKGIFQMVWNGLGK